MIVAVIDVGTNSTRLLIADVINGEVKVLQSELTTTRLGEGMEKGYLLKPAVDRTLVVIKKYLKTIQALPVERMLVVATSAVRCAKNRKDFLEMSKSQTNVQIQVLSGQEEALFGYLGVLSSLPVNPKEVVVMDVGGGSTEFTWQKGGRISSRSINVGAVRATEGRYPEDQIRRLLKPVLDEINEISPAGLVGTGGTATTLAAMALRLPVYNPVLTHGYIIKYAQIADIFSLLSATPLEKRQQLPGLQPERADIIIAGGQIILLVLAGLGIDSLLVSEADLMYGLALKLSK